jgi:hypothetical protein
MMIDPFTGIEVVPGVCLWCGAPFEVKPGDNDNPHLYCSPSHKYKRKNARTKMRGRSMDGICPYQFKIQFAHAADAAAFPAFNSKIHDVYRCRCGAWHYGRKVPGAPVLDMS